MAKTIEINGHTFEVLRAGTISGSKKIHHYRIATKRNLEECYDMFSEDKWEAFVRCRNLCRDIQGKNHKIAAYNLHTFSFAFELRNGVIVYITKGHDYIIL